MKNAIAYYRVSTDKQGASGLGLDAQKLSVRQFAEREGYAITGDFTEVESGKKNQRPELTAALARCRKERATLIIATLTRLSRNVAFIANLMESRVQFKTVDDPYADDLTIHIRAAFAQHERKEISKRTKAALNAAKMRGRVLGRHGAEVLAPQNAAAAVNFAEQMRPIIEGIQAEGFKSRRQICTELNRRQIPTFRKGASWHYSSVNAMLNRLQSNNVPHTIESTAA